MRAREGDEPVLGAVLPDGRCVTYRVFGDPSGHPVLALHGTPGSRLKYAIAADAARALGLRLLSIDRWGYGGTDRHPQPSLAAFAEDAAAFADALSVGRFGVIGVSGGGPYAAAVAAVLSRRITGLALVAPVGRMAGVAKPPGMTLFHRVVFRGLPRTPGAMRAIFAGFRVLLARHPSLALRVSALRAAPVDRRVLLGRPEGQALLDTFVTGLAPGVDGPVVDLRLFSAPWDVDLGAISAPSRLWIGDADRHVPIPAARLLAASIPACDCVDLPGAGHYWILQQPAVREVLGWLTAAMRRNG